LVLLAWLAPAAPADLSLLAFPLKPDPQADITQEDTFDREQVFLVVLQHFATVTDYDPDHVWIKQAFMSGLLDAEDLHYNRMTPPLALKYLKALSYDPQTRQDAAFWGTHTRTDDGVEALELTLVDLQTQLTHTGLIENTDDMLNELAAVFIVETIEQMRAEGDEVGSSVDGDVTPPPGETGPAGPPPGGESAPPPADPGAETDPPTNEGTDVDDPGDVEGSEADRAAAQEGWALIAQAQELSAINQYEQALEVLRPFESLGVTDPEVLFLFHSDRGQYWMKVGNEAAAREDLEKALEYASPDAQETLRRQIAQLDRTQMYGEELDGGKWDVHPTAAIENHLAHSNPRDLEARWALVERYSSLQPQPDWRSTLKHLEALSLYLPNHPDVMRETARCYIGLGRADEAAASLEQWRDVMPHSFGLDASLLYADALVAAGRADEAIGVFWEAIQDAERIPRLDDDQYATLFQAAEAYLTANMPPLAEAVEKSLELFSQGERGVGYTREELRTRITDARPMLSRLLEVLEKIRPTPLYEEWRPHMISGLLLLQQAVAETVYSLDANDRQAGNRAFEAWGLAMDSFQAAVDAAESAAAAAEAAEGAEEGEASPDAVIGL
jgi:tetratricopeptide (TPR) repeat protein